GCTRCACSCPGLLGLGSRRPAGCGCARGQAPVLDNSGLPGVSTPLVGLLWGTAHAVRCACASGRAPATDGPGCQVRSSHWSGSCEGWPSCPDVLAPPVRRPAGDSPACQMCLRPVIKSQWASNPAIVPPACPEAAGFAG